MHNMPNNPTPDALADAIRAAYIDGADAVHDAWIGGHGQSEADFGEAASDYVASVDLDAFRTSRPGAATCSRCGLKSDDPAALVHVCPSPPAADTADKWTMQPPPADWQASPIAGIDPADMMAWKPAADTAALVEELPWPPTEAYLNEALAKIVGPWWSEATANYIRMGKLEPKDIKAKYAIRDIIEPYAASIAGRIGRE